MRAIGAVAKQTGLKIPTIRFYEQEGLIRAPERTDSGRRLYADADVRRLSFIRHARALGFELDDIRSLLDLADDPDRPCDEADRIARAHLVVVEARIAQLKGLQRELNRIVRSCAGGVAADCRVIDALADHDACTREHAAITPKPKLNSTPMLRSKARRKV
jgi:DNA-binding transcriptional MerR regulator